MQTSVSEGKAIVHIGIILYTLLFARLAGARHILYRLSKLGIVRTVKFKYLLFRKRLEFDRNSCSLATYVAADPAGLRIAS